MLHFLMLHLWTFPLGLCWVVSRFIRGEGKKSWRFITFLVGISWPNKWSEHARPGFPGARGEDGAWSQPWLKLCLITSPCRGHKALLHAWDVPGWGIWADSEQLKQIYGWCRRPAVSFWLLLYTPEWVSQGWRPTQMNSIHLFLWTHIHTKQYSPVSLWTLS